MTDAPLSAELLAAIRANAEMAVKELGGTSDVAGFGLNEKSVAWVEGFIERQRGGDPGALVSVLGSFLGEAIIARAGGAWMQSEQGPGVGFANNAMCFPFAKVAKQFADGRDEGESVLGFLSRGGGTDRDGENLAHACGGAAAFGRGARYRRRYLSISKKS